MHPGIVPVISGGPAGAQWELIGIVTSTGSSATIPAGNPGDLIYCQWQSTMLTSGTPTAPSWSGATVIDNAPAPSRNTRSWAACKISGSSESISSSGTLVQLWVVLRLRRSSPIGALSVLDSAHSTNNVSLNTSGFPEDSLIIGSGVISAGNESFTTNIENSSNPSGGSVCAYQTQSPGNKYVNGPSVNSRKLIVVLGFT